MTRSQSQQALALLVAQYEALTDLSPSAADLDLTDAEATTRRVCSIVLSGDFAQWDGARGVYHALGGLIRYFGAESLVDVRNESRANLERAVWLCMRAVPERSTTEVVRIIRRVLEVSGGIQGDWASIAGSCPDQIRRIVHRITAEPVAAHLIMQTLGAREVRPTPSGGSAICGMRLGVVPAFEPAYFHEGFTAVRAETRRILEHMPSEVFLALEWWGNAGCDGKRHELGDCSCPLGDACPWCPAQHLCRGLVEGLI